MRASLGISVILLLASVLAACAMPGVASREVEVTLRGANETPPNRSTATGRATFWVHADRTVSGIVETSGIEATAAHLHLGGPGEAGAMAIDLVRTSSDGPVPMEHLPVSGASWTVPRSARFDEEQFAAFQAGRIYVHVHSAAWPEGEIRGQLRP